MDMNNSFANRCRRWFCFFGLTTARQTPSTTVRGSAFTAVDGVGTAVLSVAPNILGCMTLQWCVPVESITLINVSLLCFSFV
jgi:hypothetical protein